MSKVDKSVIIDEENHVHRAVVRKRFVFSLENCHKDMIGIEKVCFSNQECSRIVSIAGKLAELLNEFRR